MAIHRTAAALLIALPLVVAGGAVKPVPPDPLDRDQIAEARFYAVKTHVDPRCDLVVLGDSRALRAVAPAALEAALPGLRCFNFAFNAGGLNPEMYAEAERRLDPASPSPVVVLAVTPLSIMSVKAANEQFHEVRDQPRDERWILLRAPALAEWFAPVAPAEVLRAAFRVPARSRYEQEFHDDGWIASLRTPTDTTDVFVQYTRELTGNTTDPRLVDALVDQTRAWTRRGVRVVAFRPPTTDDAEAMEDGLLGFQESALVAAFAAAGGTWLDFPNGRYRTYDGSHLRRESALAFSRDLGAELRRVLDRR